ncbi:LacI family DNA-binding transcriptional regulator [Deinococcus sonorensis]|uniref:LacI family DNA-binding transcriptional regulator n=2 Tax=Deinococcus sonorensis TaxID=309891 RepID=A0AAU7UD74_9DEIO
MSGLAAVAKLAQVSPATASRALHRPEMVARETRERVEQAAEQLGYRPNQLARSLRTRDSRTLALVVTDILNPFSATIAKAVQDTADQSGHNLFLFNSDEEPDKERRALETLRGHLPQGLIVVPTPGARENLELVPDLPVIELDRASGRPGAYTVMVDNRGGAYQAVRHLLDLGHTRIGMIVGRRNISTAQERYEGYCQALDEAGLPYQEALVLPGNHREEDGRQAATQLLSQPAGVRPTALFVGNNEMTVGAVLAARQLQLSLPGDLSVVGFDDSRWARTTTPSITVIAQPTYQLGQLACQRLIQLMSGVAPPEAHTRLPTTLIVRESTGPPPAR